MFAQLGKHIFKGLITPTSQSESYATRYNLIPMVNRKDVMQSNGDELTEISLSIHYSIEFCDPDSCIDELQTSRKNHEVLPYIMGNGTFVGNFVIISLEKSIERMSSTGKIEEVTISLSLLENADAKTPDPVGQAMASQNPIPETPIPPAVGPSPAAGITQDISKANDKVSRMKESVAKVKKGTSDLKTEVRKVQKMADDAKRLYNNAKNKVEVSKNIIKRAGQLPASLDEVLNYAANLAAIDNLADVSMLEGSINNLSKSAAMVTQHATPVVAYSATREGGD